LNSGKIAGQARNDEMVFRGVHQTNKPVNRHIGEITIIMGGTDAKNLTPEIADRLSALSYEKNIVSASSIHYPGYKTLSKLSAEQIAELFLRSDLVISAGGQTVNELIQMNTPAILIEAAQNQCYNINAAVKRGLVLTCKPNDIADTVAKMDYDTRRRLSENMKEYDFSYGTSNIIGQWLVVSG